MKKLDLKGELKHLYGASAQEVREVEVAQFDFLAVDGEGDPNGSLTYAQAIEALYSVAYTLKFTVKKGSMAIDYGVMPLEGLWWADDMSQFSATDKSNWKWTIMIMQPSFLKEEHFLAAVEQIGKKKKDLPALPKVRWESFCEGRCAQILHVGPFSEEGPTIERVHGFIESRGQLTGKHHEIYLSDIRKTAPEKWKTIIRQPFR